MVCVGAVEINGGPFESVAFADTADNAAPLPCNGHDRCLDTCNTTLASCNEAFAGDLIETCGNLSDEELVCAPDCAFWAGTYALTVALVTAAGELDDRFENGQNHGCQCCYDDTRTACKTIGPVQLRSARLDSVGSSQRIRRPSAEYRKTPAGR